MELMHLISMYAALHALMMCCFTERSLSKVRLRLWTIPANSTLVLLRMFLSVGVARLTEDDNEKRTALVLSLFSLSLLCSNHSPVPLTQP